jgi:Chaperone of endosialidase
MNISNQRTTNQKKPTMKMQKQNINTKSQTLILIPIVIIALALLPQTQAVSPAPDGGYPGGNTAEGQKALLSRTTGGFNTAVGYLSLGSDTTGQFNTAIGAGTLLANTADENTGTGVGALLSNTTGAQNTANGAFALFSNTTGNYNTANGFQALTNNTGELNTANGYIALVSNTTGFGNTADGYQTLVNNSTGNGNTALGMDAGSNVITANNVICIGDVAGADMDNTAWIANIYGTTTVSGTTLPVVVSDSGQLGTASSSRRFKNEIKPMDKASEAILALKPVTFHYKSDHRGTPQFGLIAEDVAAANPDLVVHDKDGEIYTVRYDAVNAMLLNEFLKEHRTVQELESSVAKQEANTAKEEATIARQQKQIEALTAGLQKVSAQLEANKPAPQVVNNL